MIRFTTGPTITEGSEINATALVPKVEDLRVRGLIIYIDYSQFSYNVLFSIFI